MTYEFTIITIIIPLYQGYSWDIPSLFCRLNSFDLKYLFEVPLRFKLTFQSFKNTLACSWFSDVG